MSKHYIISDNLVPNGNGSYSIGTSSNKFSSIYLSDSITLNTFKLSSDGSVNLSITNPVNDYTNTFVNIDSGSQAISGIYLGNSNDSYISGIRRNHNTGQLLISNNNFGALVIGSGPSNRIGIQVFDPENGSQLNIKDNYGTGHISLYGSISGNITITTDNSTGTWSLTLPTDGGTSSYFLQTDGNGTTNWALPTSVNFANTDLSFTGNRVHSTNDNYLEIKVGNNTYDSSILILGNTSSFIRPYTLLGHQVSYIWFDLNDSVRIATSDYDRLSVFSQSIVINDSAFDFDVNIKGNTDQNLLYVDASSDSIGIGTNTPTEKLTIQGTASVDGFIMTKDAQSGYILTSGTFGNSSWISATISGLGGWTGTFSADGQVVTVVGGIITVVT